MGGYRAMPKVNSPQFTIEYEDVPSVRESFGLQNPKPTEKVVRVSSSLPDDIPVAQRETSKQVAPKVASKRWLIYGSLGAIALIASIAGAVVSWQIRQAQFSADASSSAETQAATGQDGTTQSRPKGDVILGHYAYKEAAPTDLEVAEGSIRLKRSAAAAYREMVAAASQSGVNIVLISGFRSVADQKHLYFGVKAERGQNAQERAKVSAPPGYSEHHTGYAIDIGDANVPATNLREDFEKTAAFRWMKANAARYSFELSFPKGNEQGVSYEPWHWRYVGDIDSLKTFYKAREN